MNSTSRPLDLSYLTNSGYRLTREQLLFDLYIAYYDAARHKHKMAYVVKFERDLRHVAAGQQVVAKFFEVLSQVSLKLHHIRHLVLGAGCIEEGEI